MKIKAYWIEDVFQLGKGWIKVKHYKEYDVPADWTEEQINCLIKRKDVIRIY